MKVHLNVQGTFASCKNDSVFPISQLTRNPYEVTCIACRNSKDYAELRIGGVMQVFTKRVTRKFVNLEGLEVEATELIDVLETLRDMGSERYMRYADNRYIFDKLEDMKVVIIDSSNAGARTRVTPTLTQKLRKPRRLKELLDEAYDKVL